MLLRISGIFFLLCILFHAGGKTTLYAQEISGVVIDEETALPVAFANISIKGEPVGTITNQQGGFHLKLPGGYEKKTLVFSFVGYQTRRFSISSFHTGQTVKLKQVPAEIGEVSIRPDSTLFTLLKKAWDRIPENYASTPSLLTGFYRESILNPSGKYLSVAEAVVNSYKTSYRNRQIGQVQILKSRKNVMPGIDSINSTLFYGGPFVAHFADLVHQRKAPVNPSFFDNYKYEYLGRTLYNGESVYKFAYRNFKDTTKIQRSGIFYIEIASLAYVYFDCRTEGLWYQGTPKVKFKSSTIKILYQKDNDSWFLKSVIASHHAINLQTNKDLILNIDYVTTNYSNHDIIPIDFDQQIKYGDIFTSLADNYEDSFWEGYTILEQDSLSKKNINNEFSSAKAGEFLSSKFDEPPTPAKKLHRLVSRLNMGMGFYIHDYCFPVNNSSASL